MPDDAQTGRVSVEEDASRVSRRKRQHGEKYVLSIWRCVALASTLEEGLNSADRQALGHQASGRRLLEWSRQDEDASRFAQQLRHESSPVDS